MCALEAQQSGAGWGERGDGVGAWLSRCTSPAGLL